MTRRVLVSPRLPELRSGNAEVDRWVGEYLQAFVTQAFEQLAFLTPETGGFTPTVRGSGTAGTYELSANNSRYYRLADLVFVSIHVTLAGAITAGGTDNLQISGLPYTKVAEHVPYGTAVFSGVNWTAGANLTSDFGTADEGSSLIFTETNDNAAASIVPVSGVAANDVIAASMLYITNGVRSA